MNRFWAAVIEPLARVLNPRTIVEIGSDEGAGTQKLLEFCKSTGAHLHVVDPKPAYDVGEWRARWGEILTYHLTTSLDALPSIGPVDMALIDGDHNWYTVRNELECLHANAANARSAFPLVFLHDVGWPYGRRDLYYDPESVPAEQRQPYANAGIVPGQSALIPGGGYNVHCFNAVEEGTPRNGVRTAIDDFVSDHGGDDFSLDIVPVLFGLAILYRRSDPYPASFVERLSQIRLAPSAEALVALAERERIDALVEVQARGLRIDVLERRVEAAESAVRNNQAQMGLISDRLHRARIDAAHFKGVAAAKIAELDAVKTDFAAAKAEASALKQRWAAWQSSFPGRAALRLQRLAGVALGTRQKAPR